MIIGAMKHIRKIFILHEYGNTIESEYLPPLISNGHRLGCICAYRHFVFTKISKYHDKLLQTLVFVLMSLLRW